MLGGVALLRFMGLAEGTGGEKRSLGGRLCPLLRVVGLVASDMSLNPFPDCFRASTERSHRSKILGHAILILPPDSTKTASLVGISS